LKEVIHNPALGITPTRFIEDDPRKKGRLINGYPILADLNHLDPLLEENSISEIVISNSHLSKEKLNRLTEICKSRNIDLYRFEVSLENISTTAPP